MLQDYDSLSRQAESTGREEKERRRGERKAAGMSPRKRRHYRALFWSAVTFIGTSLLTYLTTSGGVTVEGTLVAVAAGVIAWIVKFSTSKTEDLTNETAKLGRIDDNKKI